MLPTIPFRAEDVLAAALRDACGARAFTEAPVTGAAFHLGRVGAAAGASADDVVGRLGAVVREALSEPALGGPVADAVTVFLWRYARQGYQSVRYDHPLADAMLGARGPTTSIRCPIEQSTRCLHTNDGRPVA